MDDVDIPVHDPVEVDPLIDDSNDVESQVVKLSDAQKFVKYVLNFMASQNSQIFIHYGVVRIWRYP